MFRWFFFVPKYYGFFSRKPVIFLLPTVHNEKKNAEKRTETTWEKTKENSNKKFLCFLVNCYLARIYIYQPLAVYVRFWIFFLIKT